MGIRLFYKAFQWKKVDGTEPAEDDTYAEDVTFLHKYYALETSVTRSRCIVR